MKTSSGGWGWGGGALSLLLLIACCPATAGTMVDRNGVVWAGTFEGDSIPTASSPAWSVFDKNGFAAESTDGDIYSYVSGAVGVTNSYSVGTDWAGSGGQRTAEIRVRVPSAAGVASDGAAAFIPATQDRAYDVRVYSDKIAYNGADGLLDPANIYAIDLTEFHTFRAVMDRSNSPNFRLFVDNNPSPVFEKDSFWFDSPGFDNLYFGDISAGGISGTVEVDYISWTPGLYVSVPEPTSGLLLTGIICAVGLRRARVQW